MELIATLPPIHRQVLLRQIIAHPSVSAVRYNIGVQSSYSPEEILEQLVRLTKAENKTLYLDLKGRQLRIDQWADPLFGKVVLNHKLSVDCPATVFLRGDESTKVVRVDGNVIYLDPPPRYALGAGQAINIHGTNLSIDGYLTEDDYHYLQAGLKLGIRNFMLSFVESQEDVDLVGRLIQQQTGEPCNLILKIESPKGVEFIRSQKSIANLMAARDDMFINTQRKVEVLDDLQMLVQKDPQAILASRIFSGLEQTGHVTLADLSDLHLMHQFGYQRFMLSDGLCARNFNEAIRAWEEYTERYGG